MLARAPFRVALLAHVFLTSVALAQSTQVAPRFTAATIQTSAPNTVSQMRSKFVSGRYEIGNASAVDLIQTAWNVSGVTGGPAWIGTDRFDITATAPVDASPETLHAMLKNLIEDQFHLVAHIGVRDQPAYALTVGKKHRLKQSNGTPEAGCRFTRAGYQFRFVCRNISMPAFVQGLPRMAGADAYLLQSGVIDQTALSGAWDFDVEWSPPNTDPKMGEERISLFDALQKQLGLKLDRIHLAARVLVVDSIDRPAVSSSSVADRPPAFEVATIKPNSNPRCSNVGIEPGGHVHIDMTLKGLVGEAWGDLNPQRIVEGPKSMDAACWAIDARAATQGPANPEMKGALWNGVDLHSMRMMLRSLLVDRFKLTAHAEDRNVPGYALVAAKPKLAKADPSNRPGCKDGPGADGKDPRIANPRASRLMTCTNLTLAEFAYALSTWSGDENPILFNFPPVVDATGIDGRYDMTVNFTPARPGSLVSAVPASEPDGTITIYDALRQQLGLKLEARKVTAAVLVIDHVELTPTEN